MANETKGLDALYPFARFSVLSLFPRTLGDLQTDSQRFDLEQELDSLHGHVKSLVFRSPKKLLDQAKAVMEDNNKKLNTNVPSNAPSQDNSKVIVAAADDNPKKRRLGLDRKRPHFSLKPDLSEPSVILEPSFDIDNYEDPDEFFAAFGRFEHTKKELQKQSGISRKDNDHFSSQERRTRRPGLGRSYKHLFSESNILPQEVLAKDANAPSNVDFQESVELNNSSEERDLTGSEKGVDKDNGLLNELLSKSLEDLEGDGAVNLVQKHLQMKDFSIETLCLPEMQNVRMVSMKASVGNTVQPRRALSDIQNLSKGVLSSSDAKHTATESSKTYLFSKNRPKSPHAQVAMLKKRLFDATSSVDPFSSIYVDEVDAHSEDVNMSNNTCISGKMRSHVTIADDNAATEMGTSGASLEHSVDPFSSIYVDEVDAHSEDVNMSNNTCISGKMRSHVTIADDNAATEMGTSGASLEHSVDPFSSIYVDEVDAHSEDVNMSNNTCISGKMRSHVTIADDNAATEMGTSGASLEHSVDPFSSIYVDEVDAHSEDVNMSNNTCISGKMRSHVTIADDNAATEMGTSGASLEHSVHTHGDDVSLNFNEEYSHAARSIHINDGLANTICGIDIDQSARSDDIHIADSSLHEADAMIPSESDPNMDNLNLIANTVTTDLGGPLVCSIIEEQTKDNAPDQQVEEPTQAPPNEKSKGKLGTRKSRKRKTPLSYENPEDISNPATVDRENAAPEEPLEVSRREIANEQSKFEQRKQKQQRMKLDSSRRQSLSGAGTKWEKCMLKKGEDESEKVVRRSTRIRSRPLAYWKGERFLYGRVHQSLATVIGVKSFGSPGDDGKASLKVKSFVDDKFIDLVEFAGLH